MGLAKRLGSFDSATVLRVEFEVRDQVNAIVSAQATAVLFTDHVHQQQRMTVPPTGPIQRFPEVRFSLETASLAY